MSSTLYAVVAEVCAENSRPPREMDQEIVRRAVAEKVEGDLMLIGAGASRRRWENDERRTAVRSGHNNGSGLMREASRESHARVREMPVQVGGIRYSFGELDAALSQQLISERSEQLAEDQRWLHLFERCEAERKRRRVKHIGDLSDAILDSIRREVFGDE